MIKARQIKLIACLESCKIPYNMLHGEVIVNFDECFLYKNAGIRRAMVKNWKELHNIVREKISSNIYTSSEFFKILQIVNFN